MPAYIILQSTVKDEAQYQKYAQAAWPLMVRFGRAATKPCASSFEKLTLPPASTPASVGFANVMRPPMFPLNR
jgi:hypothetical protein